MKKVVILVTVLMVIVGITAFINKSNLHEKATSQADAILRIKADDIETEVDFNTIKALEEVEFAAVLRSSGKPDVDTTFKGVQLKDILDKMEIDIAGKAQIVTKAVDAYTVALSMAEVLEDDNVYVVYERDGANLETKKDGGSGPYMLVIRNDQFGQRWNKFLMEITLQ
ncbi:MAG: molybdopterin-dependent oxidoreductase [Firmicutes bacterium]|nr:molybdopterin-dependent oxidoreductase [Bacillota bacterium]